jgi:hypothetical protein
MAASHVAPAELALGDGATIALPVPTPILNVPAAFALGDRAPGARRQRPQAAARLSSAFAPRRGPRSRTGRHAHAGGCTSGGGRGESPTMGSSLRAVIWRRCGLGLKGAG